MHALRDREARFPHFAIAEPPLPDLPLLHSQLTHRTADGHRVGALQCGG